MPPTGEARACDSSSVRAVLVVNAGSTSLKLHLVDAEGEVERVDDFDAVAAAAAAVGAVGHRIVHGGDRFRDPVAIDEEVEREIGRLAALAPLQHPPALDAIAKVRVVLPDVPQVAVFDTAFHGSIPPEASTYAVPRHWREDWRIRRYGFHGLSVEWIAEQVRVPRLVVCHLGGGCSVTAVLDGRSLDTTMGFSPLEGVPMATRSGSIDPAALVYVLRERGLSVDELERALQEESGLAALGGLDTPLGYGVYTYRVAQAAGAMAVALGGVDAIAFSGGVGENRPDVRSAIVERLRFLGDFAVEVVQAREELVVARAVRRVLNGAAAASKDPDRDPGAPRA
jgi:acetate kinase